MKQNHLTLKVFALLVVNDVLDSVAQLCMKKGLAQTGISSVGLNNIFQFGFLSLSSWLIWAGILVYIISFVLWLVILYRIDISIAMPVGSTAYVFIPLLAIFFLHEQVSPLRWLGIVLVVLGIHFTAQSSSAKKGAV
ncbi:MAG: EamA family transporter [Candidatus Omnitrophica bacterium]|nr:EamA family transporter [Candidatus Omnitrophota bacterium]